MSNPTFKSFITEKEIEDVKKKRQEEWEKVRKPDQPLERPEEKFDNRTLYEKLKQQKDQKQEEWDDQHKFKNMIYKGLDDEEAGFLTLVAKKKAEKLADVTRREREELSEYREAVMKLQDEQECASSHQSADLKLDTKKEDSNVEKSEVSPAKNQKHQKSQLSLIAGSIKTKRKRNPNDESAASTTSSESKKMKPTPSSSKAEREEGIIEAGSDSNLKKVESNSGLLGLLAYSSDSSDSEN